MRASFYEGSRTFRTGPIPRPSRAPDQALVRVRRAGICGTDLHIFQGHLDHRIPKGGIIGLTLPMARDLSAIGVRVVTIAPGTFRTPAYGQMPDEMVQHLESMTPFPKRMGRPDEYAALVEHICTNSMLNGEVIRIDGAVRFPPK